MKNLKQFILEAANTQSNVVYDFLKKTFKNVTVEERDGAEGFPNPFTGEEEKGIWFEYILDDYDPIISVAYCPKHNKFGVFIDSIAVWIENGAVVGDEEGTNGIEATEENIKLYNKKTMEQIVTAYEDGEV